MTSSSRAGSADRALPAPDDRAPVRPFDVEDPLGQPSWHTPAGPLTVAPYAAIGHLRGLRGADELASGTCWCVGENRAVTAAHVVASSQDPEVTWRIDFPGEPNTAVRSVRIPQDYAAQEPFDPWDIAVLELAPKVRSTLAIGTAASTDVQVVGFPSREHGMVESRGALAVPDEVLLLHQADTAAGHSGAPVLMTGADGTAVCVGVHVGGFSNNPLAASFPRHNVALGLRDALRAFIAPTSGP